MKTILKSALFSIAGFFFSAVAVKAQCTADFTWMQTANNIIAFTNTSFGNCTLSTYEWDFGDQNVVSTHNPVHTYNIPGSYIVTLSVRDTMSWTITSTFTDTITVTGNIICNLSAQIGLIQNPTCGSCADGVIDVNISGGTPPYVLHWNSGDSTYTLLNAAPGTYIACVTDSNNCAICDTIQLDTLTPPVICQPSFTYSQTVANVVDFTGTATNTNASTMYFWQFGDANSAFGTSVSNTYLYTGSYLVCLSTYDSLNLCSGSYCDTVNVWGNSAACSSAFTTYYDSLFTNTAWITNQSQGAQPMSYTWYWGDNTFDTIPFPSHTYTTSGLYNICLVTHDAAGCTDSSCQGIQVMRLAYHTASVPFYVNVIGATATAVQEQTQEGWSLFPNPAENEIRFKSDYSLTGKQYYIIDITGRIITNGKISGATLDVSLLDKGMYFLQIENTKGGFSTQRFMKD